MVRGKWEQAFADERWERKMRAGKTETQIWYDGYGSPRVVEVHYDWDGNLHIDSIYDPGRLIPLEKGFCTTSALLGILAGAVVCGAVMLNDNKDMRSEPEGAPARILMKEDSTQAPSPARFQKNRYEGPKWDWKRTLHAIQPKPVRQVQPHEKIWAGRRH